MHSNPASLRLLFAFALVTAFGCQAATTEDGQSDRFAQPGGAADAYGVTEGGYLALAVLDLANRAPEQVLADDVGLSGRTVQNIAQTRESGPIASLSALDAIDWVGPVSFDRMVAYVEGTGLVGSCGDGAVQENEDCDGGSTCSSTCQADTGSGATSMLLDLRLVDSSESGEPGEGWVFDEDEYGWIYEDSLRVDSLPHQISAGDFSVSLREDGTVSVGYSYGDADASADSSAKFPVAGGLLAGTPGSQYEVSVSGGDHASGSWGCDGTLRITLD